MSDDAADLSGGFRDVARRTARSVAGSVLGAVLVPALLGALLAAPLSARPPLSAAGWVARRLTLMDGAPRLSRPAGGRLVALLFLEALLGLVAGAIIALVVIGLVVAGQMIVGAATGGAVPVFGAAPGEVTWSTVAVYLIPGAFLLFLAVAGLAGISWLDRRAWSSLTRPGVNELTEEVSRLSGTLDEVVAAVDAERRRIERDIHDGVQQRVVALSIILARVDRADEGDARTELLRQGRAETQHVLEDLRAVAWRTYPAMLIRDGLTVALEALRDRTEIPVRLRMDVADLTDRPAEAAVYFIVSEAVTNVIKHADASLIDVAVEYRGPDILLTVHDDGRGGADPTGPGLSGIASRAAARGGHLHIESPQGGPTMITAVVPCG